MRKRLPGIAAVLLLLAASSSAQAPGPAAAPASVPPPPASVRANELGRVPVVMYHAIGGAGGYDSNGLNIAPATFRRQLERMHRAGWYPVNFRDLFVAGGLQSVPAGKTPVVLTFDDGRGSQFRYLKDGRIDPDCAVGILEAFHRRHGAEWPRRATFFVLPKSKYTSAVFDQPATERKKLRFLLDAGYEIGNHSTTHPNMRDLGPERVLSEVRTCRDYVKKLAPDATMDTFCLPYGEAPRHAERLDLILRPEGARNPAGRNLGICIAWGDESFSPYDRRFDRRRVTRFGVHPGRFENAIRRLGPGGADHGKVYVSDGEPAWVTVPKPLAKYADAKRLGGARLAVYDPKRVPKADATAHTALRASPASRGVSPGSRR